MRVCAETIYQSLFVQARGRAEAGADRASAYPARAPQAAGRSRAEERRGKLVGTISISQRPAEAADRAVPGHWEGDLIMGRDNGSAIGTLVERSTRFVMLIHLPGAGTPPRSSTTRSCRPSTPCPSELRRSLTWDNGKEMAMHHQITMATGMQVYFADPRSPWQRGSNENTNGLLRQYFPKGISLRQFDPDTSPPSPASSTADPARPSTGAPQPKPSTTYSGKPFEPPVLR